MAVYSVAAVVLSYGVAGVIAAFVEFPLSNVETGIFKVVGLGVRESTRQGVEGKEEAKEEVEEGEVKEKEEEDAEGKEKEGEGEEGGSRSSCNLEVAAAADGEGRETVVDGKEESAGKTQDEEQA